MQDQNGNDQTKKKKEYPFREVVIGRLLNRDCKIVEMKFVWIIFTIRRWEKLLSQGIQLGEHIHKLLDSEFRF